SEDGSLLGGYSSEDVTSVTSTRAAEPAAPGEASPRERATDQSALPVWAIVGTCVGAALLILLLAMRRRDKSDATEGRRG
ncbi:MAG: hypothetical protein MSA61_04640, partial [Coriobacteriaceae bacterium]|nr:hypothetical protein [Coriobacteriaceae bacterium]